MYNNDMKLLIKYAVELEITGLRTFEGYNGGSMLAFSSDSKEVMELIKKFCHRMEVDTNIKTKNGSFEIFCAFGKDRFKMNNEDQTIYDLKL